MQITAELQERIDRAVAQYPVSKRSAALPLLHLFQEHFGHIGADAILWIAARLELEPINVLELVTFYPMFRQQPAGRFHIRVCRTLSCAMAGSAELLREFCRLANIPESHDDHDRFGPHVRVSPDGRFSVEFVECLASCGTAPVCMVNDDFYEGVDAAKAGDILRRYQ